MKEGEGEGGPRNISLARRPWYDSNDKGICDLEFT